MNIIRLTWCIFILMLSLGDHSLLEAKRGDKGKSIVIVIPSYNNVNWCFNNLNSVIKQQYDKFRVIYIDDHSVDGTLDAVIKFLKRKKQDYRIITFDASNIANIHEVTEKFKKEVNTEYHKFTVVSNIKRSGALCNLYRAIQSCDDNEIIVTLDGDDWFYNNKVLKRLNEVYASSEIWLTHGSIITYPDNRRHPLSASFPVHIIEQNAFRTYSHASHLRTFYAWLFKNILLEDLLYEGDFYKMTWDLAMMFPMCEMAGPRHAFINEINYVYNTANVINDHKVDRNLQAFLDQYIRQKKSYSRLDFAGQKIY